MPEKEVAFDGGIFITVASMDGIRFNRLRKQVPDGSRSGFGGIRSADQFAEIFHGIVFFQNGGYDRTGAHVADQVLVKRTFAVHRVELSGQFGRQLGVFHRNDPEARFVDLG